MGCTVTCRFNASAVLLSVLKARLDEHPGSLDPSRIHTELPVLVKLSELLSGHPCSSTRAPAVDRLSAFDRLSLGVARQAVSMDWEDATEVAGVAYLAFCMQATNGQSGCEPVAQVRRSCINSHQELKFA